MQRVWGTVACSRVRFAVYLGSNNGHLATAIPAIGNEVRRKSGRPNKRMQLTKLRAAPVLQAEVPPCAPAGQTDGGTASQLIRSVRQTSGRWSEVTRTAIITLAMLTSVHWAEAGRDSRGFFVPPTALDVIEESGKLYSSVRYYVREPYPAETTLAFICRNLEERGWRPVTGTALEKYERSSLESGWDELPGKSGRVVVRIWSARWLDAKGDQVIYTLGYSSPMAEQGLQPVYLLVSALYHDKAVAPLFRAELQKEVDRIRPWLRP
jgi:hypothetical protein